MIRTKQEMRWVEGFGCVYRVTRKTWLILGIPVWHRKITDRFPRRGP